VTQAISSVRLVDPNTRNAKRTPVTLKIKFKSETLEQFIERYAVDVSQGGIFIRTKDPLAVGTQMKFEFQLKDGSSLIGGEGTVVWTRENDPSRPAIAPGMGVRFDKLADGSNAVLERILADKQRQVPQRPTAETTKPPLFTDTPTRVAPAPVADALLGRGKDSERTPLPPPMPFHSDADDFDERAFEEATKVRSLEELAAASAAAAAAEGDLDDNPFDARNNTTIIPPDELAMRRAQARSDSTVADESSTELAREASRRAEPSIPPATQPKKSLATTLDDEDGAGLGADPFVPAAPTPRAPPTPSTPPRLLDTSPSPRTEPTSGLAGGEAGRTKLGVEPARVDRTRRSSSPALDSLKEGIKDTRLPRAPVETMPVKKPSSAPIIIAFLAVVAAVCAGVWFFVLREPAQERAANDHRHPDTGSGSTTPTQATNAPLGSDTTTPGSNAVAVVGSDATAPMPPAPDVAKVATAIAIAGTVPGATVKVDGQTGPAPLTAQLAKGKSYTARVEAPGYVGQDVAVVGGTAPAPTKLVAKLHLLGVTSDPAGAQIAIEGVGLGKVTPADVDLKQWTGKAKLHVTLRKLGYKPFDTTVDLAGATETDDKVVATMPQATLVVAPVIVQRPPPPPPHPPAGSDSNNGTTTQPAAGSDATPTPDTSKPPTSPDNGNTGNTGTAPPPPPPAPAPAQGGAGGSAEPEPDFVHH
jgi:uncharacterized protein (TIGR02266 family)